MENFINLIEKFINTSKVTLQTKDRHQKNMKDFLIYLSKKVKQNPEQINLLRIFLLKDTSGRTIKLVDLIDDYFFSNDQNGYSWLLNKRKTLSSFFQFLNRNYNFPNLMEYSQFNIKDYKPEPVEVRILSKHEIIKFTHYVVRDSNSLDRDLLLFSLLLSTGCRIYELLHLKVRDISVDQKGIKIWMSKVNRERYVPLIDGMCEVLMEFCKYHNLNDGDYVFFTDNHENLKLPDVRKLLNSYLNKAGIKPVKVHSFRHTFATLMYEAGCSPSTIQQMLGHKNIATTMKYIHPHYSRNANIKIRETDETLKLLEELIK